MEKVKRHKSQIYVTIKAKAKVRPIKTKTKVKAKVRELGGAVGVAGGVAGRARKEA